MGGCFLYRVVCQKTHLAGDSLLLDKMKNSLIFVYILSFLIINECFCSDLYSDRVIKYDAESFKTNVGNSKPHFISFFAPWYDNFLILFTAFTIKSCYLLVISFPSLIVNELCSLFHLITSLKIIRLFIRKNFDFICCD